MVKSLLLSLISPKRLMFKINMIFIIVTVLATITLSFFFYLNTSGIIKKNNEAFLEMYGNILSNNIDNYVLEMDRTAKVLLGNANVQEILLRSASAASAGSAASASAIRDYEQLQYTIWSFTSLRDFSRIIIANSNGDLVYRDSAIYASGNDNIFMDSYIEDNLGTLANGDFLLLPSYRTNFTFLGRRPLYLLARELRTLSNDQVVAYALILFDRNIFQNMFNESLPAHLPIEAVLIDADGVVALSMDMDEIGMPPSGEKKAHQYFYHTSALTGWVLRLSMQDQHIAMAVNMVLGFLLPLVLVVLGGSIVVAVFMFSYVMTPINMLVDAMGQVDLDNLTAISLRRGTHSSDLDTLFGGFNRMISEINALTENIIREKVMLNNSQMAMLRYQINPHFLYNTLQTMEAIGEVHGVPEISVIATSLGSLMRYNISSSGYATLAEEIIQVDTYLKIEQIRFKNGLSYTIEASPEARDCTVLRFILQPIVENCIVHGGIIAGQTLEVGVRAAVDGGMLSITIFNSGVPMSPERLTEICGYLDEVSTNGYNTSNMESIGILNTHMRLVNRYGPDYGISFEYSDERGTCVRLSFPAED
ncbi:MAG: histidine kinase [Oscillospiraceae bacterium]|nr:histidine kinase [Oscillospiraceae bacterium]